VFQLVLEKAIAVCAELRKMPYEFMQSGEILKPMNDEAFLRGPM